MSDGRRAGCWTPGLQPLFHYVFEQPMQSEVVREADWGFTTQNNPRSHEVVLLSKEENWVQILYVLNNGFNCYVLIMCIGIPSGESLQINRATKTVLIIKEKIFPVLQALIKYLLLWQGLIT